MQKLGVLFWTPMTPKARETLMALIVDGFKLKQFIIREAQQPPIKQIDQDNAHRRAGWFSPRVSMMLVPPCSDAAQMMNLLQKVRKDRTQRGKRKIACAIDLPCHRKALDSLAM